VNGERGNCGREEARKKKPDTPRAWGQLTTRTRRPRFLLRGELEKVMRDWRPRLGSKVQSRRQLGSETIMSRRSCCSRRTAGRRKKIRADRTSLTEVTLWAFAEEIKRPVRGLCNQDVLRARRGSLSWKKGDKLFCGPCKTENNLSLRGISKQGGLRICPAIKEAMEKRCRGDVREDTP